MNSERISLRPIKVEDTDMVLKWRNSLNVKSNFLYSEEITKNMHMDWIENKIKKGLVDQFIIYTNHEKKDIGSIYLRDIDHKAKSAEYGIFIGENEFLNKGYGTEASKLILEYAFRSLNLNKVKLRVLSDNIVAIKSYLKLGFKIEGIFKDEVMKNNELKDIIFMAILRRDYIK